MNTRRIIFIGIAIVLLLAVGVGIYFFFFAKKPALTIQPTNTSFPSGGGVVGDTTSNTPASQPLGVPVEGAGTVVGPRLIRITNNPVAEGAVAVYIPGTPPQTIASSTSTSTPKVIPGTDPEVRIEYIERESGNIYAFTAHSRTQTRLTNKTLPGVQYASWLSDGSLAYARFIERSGTAEHIDTYALPSNGGGGYFLEQDLSQVETYGSSTLLTVLPSTNGSVGTLSTPSGGNLHTLFSSPLAAVVVALGNKTFTATTKASASMDGYAFLIDSATGAFTRILGPLPGLSSKVSPSGKALLYSYLNGGKEVLGVFDLTTHTAIRLPLSTLSEKCVWASDSLSVYCAVPTNNSGTLPDDWYQGKVSFNDRIWKINLPSRTANLVIDPGQLVAGGVDAVALTVDAMNDVLVFKNKVDGTLWMYDL